MPSKRVINDFLSNNKLSKSLALLNDTIMNNISNLLNINNKTSFNVLDTTNTTYPNHESTPINSNNTLTVNPIALSINKQAQNKGIVLDSACTDSSYRASDVPNTSNISNVPSYSQLDITTANGSHVYSEGITTREFPFGIKNPIHVFNDNDLHLSMHALSSFTNHPVNGTVALNKFVFKAYDSFGNLFSSGKKKKTINCGSCHQMITT